MFNTIRQSQIFVFDQDDAIDFYLGTLGLEIHTDADLGFMRWLTVNVPDDPERQILLEKPGPPSMDEATAKQVRELVSKGATGGWLIFTTDDCQQTYETLLGRGVEFTASMITSGLWLQISRDERPQPRVDHLERR